MQLETFVLEKNVSLFPDNLKISVSNYKCLCMEPYSSWRPPRAYIHSHKMQNQLFGPLAQEKLVEQMEENSSLERMLQEQQHVIKLALARVLPQTRHSGLFCQVSTSSTSFVVLGENSCSGLTM
jgi:hypothetical protein